MCNQIKKNKLIEIQIAILNSVTDFCEKNKISYFLCYGTLLGAVRHKGFIPWDDDIDIMMPRGDYYRFINEYKNEFYTVLSCSTNHEYIYPFAKVFDTRTLLIEKGKREKYEGIGVNIDVFPMDGFPDNKIKRQLTLFRNKIYRFLYVSETIYSERSQGIIKYYGAAILNYFGKKKGSNGIAREWNKAAQKYKYDNCNYVACQVWGYSEKEIMKKSEIVPLSTIEFNGKKYTAPRNPDYYLQKLYGNYMEYPPIEQQISHHEFIVYSKK